MQKRTISIKVDVPDDCEIVDYILVTKIVGEDDVMIGAVPSKGLSMYDRTAMLELAKGYAFDEAVLSDG